MSKPTDENLSHLLSPEAVRAAAAKPVAKPAKAEDEEDKTDAKAEAEDMEDEKDEEKSKKARRARKAKKAEEPEDQGEEDNEDDDEKVKAAVLAERARCVAIFTSANAVRNPALAAHLVETGMTAEAAEKTLALAGGSAAPVAAARPTLAERMAVEHAPNPGADGGELTPAADSPKAIADLIIANAQKHGLIKKAG